MTNEEIIRNLLAGEERNANKVANAVDDVAGMIDTFIRAFRKRGYGEDAAFFLALQAFNVMVKNTLTSGE